MGVHLGSWVGERKAKGELKLHITDCIGNINGRLGQNKDFLIYSFCSLRQIRPSSFCSGCASSIMVYYSIRISKKHFLVVWIKRHKTLHKYCVYGLTIVAFFFFTENKWLFLCVVVLVLTYGWLATQSDGGVVIFQV